MSRCKRWSGCESVMCGCSRADIPAPLAACTPHLKEKKDLMLILTQGEAVSAGPFYSLLELRSVLLLLV